jgi:hypothetical protein
VVPLPNSNVYHPVVLVSPENLMPKVLGYTPTAGDPKQAAIQRAITTKQISATTRVHLVDRKIPGFILYAPIFYNDFIGLNTYSLVQCVVLADEFIEEIVSRDFLNYTIILFSDINISRNTSQTVMYSNLK